MSPEAGLTSTLTTSNMGGGTPLYRAPECAINFKRATIQSDIYSVGAILHDIFAGGAARIPHVELNVPGELSSIVQRCTKQNVRRR
jgi:eukaryotic-like serine/threonine-protein kinase